MHARRAVPVHERCDPAHQVADAVGEIAVHHVDETGGREVAVADSGHRAQQPTVAAKWLQFKAKRRQGRGVLAQPGALRRVQFHRIRLEEQLRRWRGRATGGA